MKRFDVPVFYRSPLLAAVKKKRKEEDRMKKDFTPTLLDFGRLKVYLARHFGFCYGVENAIDIAFRTIDENPGKNIYLLSEMIHNPQVNQDLIEMGVRFIQDNAGHHLIPFEQLTENDIVLIPAFGTTLPIEQRLKDIGIQIEQYNTTCPFVEKVWNRSEAIASNNYSIVIHGKPDHEETRATFSHAGAKSPSVVIKDMDQAIILSKFITKEIPASEFDRYFLNQHTEGFDPETDLQRFGVVNQTTMLASETQAIADFLKEVMKKKYLLNEDTIKERFADTRDTLCYATLDNQMAVSGMLNQQADLAFVIGGYKSSNTSHLVELCEKKLPTYYIENESKILSQNAIMHFDFHNQQELVTENYLPDTESLNLLITSGASCPDALVEKIIMKMANFYGGQKHYEALLQTFQ